MRLRSSSSATASLSLGRKAELRRIPRHPWLACSTLHIAASRNSGLLFTGMYRKAARKLRLNDRCPDVEGLEAGKNSRLVDSREVLQDRQQISRRASFWDERIGADDSCG
jgi:hypothetical protein